MPVYKVQIDEFRARIVYFFLNPASSETSILGQSLETDSDIVENCVIPDTLFRTQYTWLASRLSHNLTNGSSVDISSDIVFTTFQANGTLQPAYRMQIVEDVGNLPFSMRQHFTAFQLSRKEVRPNFEHEQQEREAVYFYWGVDANDLQISISSIFPDKEETNSYPPGYGPPLGEDWRNSDNEQAEVLVPETPD